MCIHVPLPGCAPTRKRLSVAKANYAAQRILCDVQSVNDGTGHPLAFAVATADARAGGDDDEDAIQL